MSRTCESCGGPLPQGSHWNRRFCDTCRIERHNTAKQNWREAHLARALERDRNYYHTHKKKRTRVRPNQSAYNKQYYQARKQAIAEKRHLKRLSNQSPASLT